MKDRCKEIAKVSIKGTNGAIRHVNWMISSSLNRIGQLEVYLKDQKRRLVRAIRIEGGYQEIIYFLESILEKDIIWHKKIVELYNTEIASIQDFKERRAKEEKWVKSNIMFAKMREEEALIVFQRDLDSRFEKLVKQLQDKVGAVTNVYLVRNDNYKLDGRVTGEKGEVYLETIIAGGHNIQREHYRTLIK
ncbi:hypothetical protein D3C71_1508620 [compost metagenome]